MKRILFIVAIILAGQMAFGQAYFPTVDSGRKFTNRYIRNSAIEAFTNLRLNTVLNGMWQHIDSARLLGGGGGGGDNNFPSSLSFSLGTLTLGRTGLSNLTTSITTSNVPEAGGVLFFTTARARQSIVNGYGWNYNNTTGVGTLDTSVLGNVYLIRKTGYDTTAKIVGNNIYLKPIKLSIGNGNGTAVDLSDDTSIHWQINPTGSGGGGTLDATLTTGNVTDVQIIQEQTSGPESFQGWIGTPSNFGTVYGGIPAQRFYGLGWGRFDGVNADGRPNVVGNIFSYNNDPGGGRINSSEAAFGFRAETHYQLASVPSFEFHLPEIINEAGTGIRPFSMYIRKTTGYTEMNMMVPSVTYLDYMNQSRGWLTLTDGAGESKISLNPIANALGILIVGGSFGSAGVNNDFTVTNDGHTVTLAHNQSTANMQIGPNLYVGAGGTAGSNYKQMVFSGYANFEAGEVDAVPVIINKGAGGANILTLQEAAASRFLFNPAYLRIAMNQPVLQFYNPSAGTDAKMWISEVSGNDYFIRNYDDGVGGPVDILRFNRTGTTINYVAVPNAEFRIGSVSDNGTFTLQNTGNFYNSGSINFTASNDLIAMNGGQMEFRTGNGSTRVAITSAGDFYVTKAVAYQGFQTHTTGATVTISANVHTLVVDPASVLANLTITMPAAPLDGQEIRIVFGGTIAGGSPAVTTLTISANSGQTLVQVGAPSSANSGECLVYQYKLSNTSWYRIK